MIDFNISWISPRTTDTHWRHKSKISETWTDANGRQNMLRSYLKIWEWEWIFGRVVKANASQSVRSPWMPRIDSSIPRTWNNIFFANSEEKKGGNALRCNGQNKKFQGVYHNTKAISNGDLKWKRVEKKINDKGKWEIV